MKYGEQLREALENYEAIHGRAQMIGMTPAMYDLIKDENEKAGMEEPQGGWRTFYGVNIDVQEVADVPLFWFNGSIIIYKPHKHIDTEKVKKALEICTSPTKACASDGCPYIENCFNFPSCVCLMKKDALECIRELEGVNK